MIEFESVSKTFRDGTTAVTDLDLTVPSHKITVVVGPSGCGKTTTLRMVNRMLEPSKGRITWDGTPMRSIRKTKLRRQMGYVIQSGGLFPHRTVLENIGTVPGLLRWDKTKIRKRSFELLASVGLDPKLANRYPAQLSGGQQQRVGVARALAADPLVMLMDEPFSAVDPVVRGELHEFFLELQRRVSKTIILITHDIDEAIKLGDQVAILRVGGRLAQLGTPQQLLDEPADAFVEGFVGKDRGYRSLSFVPAAGLPLDSVPVVRDVSAAGDELSLVLDADARPLGWADRTHPTGLHPVGSTFDPETDTLRMALDAAFTSPVGLAVAVNRASGRFAGVVSAQEILEQISEVKAAQQDWIMLADPSSDQVVETHDQHTTAQPSVGDEALGAVAGAGSGVDNPDAAEGHANDANLAPGRVWSEYLRSTRLARTPATGTWMTGMVRRAPAEYAAGADAGDREMDDRNHEMSPPPEHPNSADAGHRDVDDIVRPEYVNSTGDGGPESDGISPEQGDPNTPILEASEAADAASGAGGRAGQAPGGFDGLDEAFPDPYLVERMADQDRVEADPEIGTAAEAGGTTATEDSTGQSEHSDNDTLLIQEIPVDMVPDGLMDNGQHVRSVWHESDADRAEAPVR